MDKLDTERATFVLGLLGIYLAILFGIKNLILDSSVGKVIIILKTLGFVYLIFISVLFILFLLFKLKELKYSKSINEEPSDFTVIVWYSLMLLFKWKYINKLSKKEKKEYIYKKSKDLYKFIFDETIRQTFFFPTFIIIIFLIYLGLPVLNSYNVPNIFAWGIFILIIILTPFFFKYIRIKIIGE